MKHFKLDPAFIFITMVLAIIMIIIIYISFN
jgi:hypothetical protein